MILDFHLVLPDSNRMFGERDEVIKLLESNGYHLVMTSGPTRVLMEKQNRPPKTGPCPCECNPKDIYRPKVACGGCGHAGCGWRG